MASPCGLLGVFMAICFVIGAGAMVMSRCATPFAARWGRRLSVLAVFGLGIGGLAIMHVWRDGLAALGLLAGLLVVGMLVELPLTESAEVQG